MEHSFKPLQTMFLFMTISYAAAEILHNPDFENITANGTSQFLLLNRTNTIPGWSFSGAVYYVSSGNNLSFNGGHAIQLGENGTINQTISGTNDVLDYVLSFNLAAVNEDCAQDNRTAVNVTVKERYSYNERSKVFYFGLDFSRNFWEANALYLGQLGTGTTDYINIEIKSVAAHNSGNNVISCGPLVDGFTVKRNFMPRWYDGNLLSNGDFEVGPSFIKNSSEGILLMNDQVQELNSPLQEWNILGTIKYIDSIHFKVPHGKAAIELLSGSPSGVQVDLNLATTLTYTLNFTLGDANDLCIGDLVLFLEIGPDVHNFVMSSYGRGSVYHHFVTFNARPSGVTSIVFYSMNETRTSDGVLCGPVLDNIVLVGSNGERVTKLMFTMFITLGLVIIFSRD
ncbi:Protein of unknown function- DUF642 [Striga hermonthica]|uniref:DUF642 domain-containing protein n=1 Tax=Striga hermonthica TaxID=68872 RepID=A0A9N7N8Y8_STRHE|nr:Protein of unknown function- DUF642 [Striga hermonthica]